MHSYGKGGIAGLQGEQEHVVACVTTVFGDALREAVGGGRAWISSATKTASAGTAIDIPLAHKDELYIRSHYDAIAIGVPDGPRSDELMICVAVASGGRVHERVGRKIRQGSCRLGGALRNCLALAIGLLVRARRSWGDRRAEYDIPDACRDAKITGGGVPMMTQMPQPLVPQPGVFAQRPAVHRIVHQQI